MENVYLLLGSNVGKPKENVANARKLIERRCGKMVQYSALYETGAWGVTQQANFINQAVNLTTGIEPFGLLAILKNIEAELGRTQTERWGPRIIDVDILFYGDTPLDGITLKIPHPAIQSRRFTLEPMNEIAPTFIHPVLKKTMSELLEACKDDNWVRRLNF